MLAINFDPFPLLATDRLNLRRVEQSDLNEMFFLRSDPRVMKYLDRNPFLSIHEASFFIQNLHDLEKNNDAITWAMTLKDNPLLIGTICIWNISKEHHRGEVGYAMHPDHHGKGIMNEALVKVLDYGFKTLKLHSMEANVNPGNAASIKLLERNNFVREAYYKENYFYNGKFLDTAIYSLLTPVKK